MRSLPAFAEMRTDITFHKIWRETDLRLRVLAERVAENKEVMSSLDFARWLRWSGVLQLLEAHSCDGELKVDGANLRWRCEELERACQDRFAVNDTKPHLEELQLQSINEKLNVMAGYLSKLTVAGGVVSAPAAAGPELRVISGGRDETAGTEKRTVAG